MSLEEPILIQNETHAPFERYDLSSLETNGMMRPLAWIEQVAILTVTQDCNATHDDKFRAKLLSIRTTQIHIALNRFKRHLCPSTEKEDARAKWEHLAPNTKNNQGHLARFIDTAHSSPLFAILGSRFALVLRSVEAMAPSPVGIDSAHADFPSVNVFVLEAVAGVITRLYTLPMVTSTSISIFELSHFFYKTKVFFEK